MEKYAVFSKSFWRRNNFFSTDFCCVWASAGRFSNSARIGDASAEVWAETIAVLITHCSRPCGEYPCGRSPFQHWRSPCLRLQHAPSESFLDDENGFGCARTLTNLIRKLVDAIFAIGVGMAWFPLWILSRLISSERLVRELQAPMGYFKKKLGPNHFGSALEPCWIEIFLWPRMTPKCDPKICDPAVKNGFQK